MFKSNAIYANVRGVANFPALSFHTHWGLVSVGLTMNLFPHVCVANDSVRKGTPLVGATMCWCWLLAHIAHKQIGFTASGFPAFLASHSLATETGGWQQTAGEKGAIRFNF